jgi:hypothetical protein
MSYFSTTRSAAVLALLCCSLTALGQVAAARGPHDALAVTVTGGSALTGTRGELPLGAVSYANTHDRHQKGQRKSYSVAKHVSLTISRQDGATGRAMLRAYLVQDCGSCVIRMNGVQLTTNPTVVGRVVPLNRATDHTIEIEITTLSPPGDLHAEIGWLAEEL